jgi:hypothetical protein
VFKVAASFVAPEAVAAYDAYEAYTSDDSTTGGKVLATTNAMLAALPFVAKVRQAVRTVEEAEEAGQAVKAADEVVTAAEDAGQTTKATIQELRAAHEAAVAKGALELEAEGYKVTRNVTFEGPNGERAIADAVISKDNQYRVLDWKRGGTAPLTPNQEIVYPAIERGEAIPVGQRAKDAGLIPGTPMKATPVDVKPY